MWQRYRYPVTDWVNMRGVQLLRVQHRRACNACPSTGRHAVHTCQLMSPWRLKQCGAARGCPATGVPHTQPGSGGAAVRPSPRPMDGSDGARRMPPAAHALVVPMAGIDGADRSVRGTAAAPPVAAGTAVLRRARLLARLLAQARMAAVKQPAGAGSTLQCDRRVMHGHMVDHLGHNTRVQ